MAAVWGEAEVRVHVDGTALPREVREITSEAGNIGGDNFNKSFRSRVADGFKDTWGKVKGWFSGLWNKWFKRGGKNLGDGFTDGFRDSMKTFKLEFDKMTTDIARRSTEVDFSHWGDDLGNLKRVFPEITDGFRQLAIEGNKGMQIWEPMAEDIGDLHQVFDDAAGSANRFGGAVGGTEQRAIGAGKAFEGYNDKVRGHNGLIARMHNQYDKLRSSMNDRGGIVGWLKKLSGGFDDATGAGNRHGSMWKRLSANTRQWTLIIGAVIGAMGDLAGLASAAGAGIFVLGSALGSLAVGGIAAIAIIKNLTQDLEDAPKSMKPIIREFGRFKKAIGTASDEIALSAFAEMGGMFDSLGETVKGLTPALKKMGTALGRLGRDFAKSIAPGTEAFNDLNTFIENSVDIVDRLARAVGKFAGAVVRAFNRANPLTQKFVGWVELLIDRFDQWTRGEGFDQWLSHADSVFGAFGGLLDTVGRLLNDMVTDESIESLVNFIDSIDSFLQGGGKGILEFAQGLDVFGLLAEALDALGDALEPLGGPMRDFAEALHDVISTGIETLGPIITDVAEALAPLVQHLADFMKQNPQLFADILLAIAAGFLAIKAVGIAKNVTSAIAGFVGVAGKKNTGKLVKFGAAIAGISLAMAGLAEQNKEGGGLEGGGLGVLETIGGGALSGAMFGPIGVAIGALGGAIASMIQDMFMSPEIEGAWKTGWDQIFDPNDFSGAGIGTIKENIKMIIPIFAEGFAEMGSNIQSLWMGVKTVFMDGWQGIVDFFTVGIPGFFTGIVDYVATGFEMLGTQVASDWEGVKTFFSDGWQTIVDFFTVSIPDFFTGIIDYVVTGFEMLGTQVAADWETIKTFFSDGWQAIVDFFTIGIPKFFTDTGKNFTTGFSTLVGYVTLGWSTLLGYFKLGWQTVVTFFTTGIPQFFSDLGANFSAGFNAIVGAIPGMFGGIVSAFSRGFQTLWDRAVSWASRIMQKIRDTLSQVPLIGGLFGGGGSGGGGAASGRMVVGPQRILVGEDGPEAIVPLRRSLSRVDSSVRALSAIAQGKSDGFPSDNVSRGGRTLNVAPGAIVIQGVRDPNAAALGVVNRLAERIAG